MIYTKSVRISGISRESRERYAGHWFGGLSDRLLGEVVREFRRLKTGRELHDDPTTVNLVLHAILRAAERADAEYGPPELLVTHDECGRFDR